jgi:hypothetical protein
MYRELGSWVLTGPHQLSLNSTLRDGFIFVGNLQHRLFRHWITHPVGLRASLFQTTHSHLNPLGPWLHAC